MKFCQLISSCFVTAILACPVLANDDLSFTDPEDGAFDTSAWLLDRKGFLPVPIIVTEPAVGYGGGAALLFFSQSLGEAAAQAKQSGHVTPPDIYGVAVAATENGTKFAGAGAMLSFDEDRWRYRGGIGYIDAQLDFFGIGGFSSRRHANIHYELSGWASSQQVLRRLGDQNSNTFVGARWLYLDLDTQFNLQTDLPLPKGKERANRSSGVGISLEYDSRDNIFTPSRGWTGSLDTLFYSPSVGSDNTFQTYRGHAFIYTPVSASLVLGTRLDGRLARGDVPFYQQPFIDLRGIQAGRYQDENVAVAELELRWNVTPRWALIGFIGAGKAWGTHDSFSNVSTPVGKGVGFRYLIARRLGLYVGVDIAKGPEDTPFYIQVGNAWR